MAQRLNPAASHRGKFDRRGSLAVLAALKASYCPCDASAILAALRLLSEIYRTQLIELHGGFDLSRSLASDLEAMNIIRSQAC